MRLLLKFAEGICQCNLKKINVDPKGDWYWLGRKNIGQKSYMNQRVELDQGATKCGNVGARIR